RRHHALGRSTALFPARPPRRRPLARKRDALCSYVRGLARPARCPPRRGDRGALPGAIAREWPARPGRMALVLPVVRRVLWLRGGGGGGGLPPPPRGHGDGPGAAFARRHVALPHRAAA